MRTFNHVGIVVDTIPEGATFNEDLSVWCTDFTKSENKIEFLKFEKGSCMPELVQKQTHLAYTVPSLGEELKGKKVIFGPVVCNESSTMAFIEEEGLSVELMEFK